VIWEPVIKTDLALPTSATLARISDSRAIQYWDPDRALSGYLIATARADPSWVGLEVSEYASDPDFIVWDAALMFPAGSHWESTLPPPSFSGGPVVDKLDAIRATLSDR